jgi:hypothetical protein
VFRAGLNDSGPFSTNLQHRVYCWFPVCGLIWQCLFQSPQYHPATNPQYRPESLPASSFYFALFCRLS